MGRVGVCSSPMAFTDGRVTEWRPQGFKHTPLCSWCTQCCSDTVWAVAHPKLLLLPVKAMTWRSQKSDIQRSGLDRLWFFCFSFFFLFPSNRRLGHSAETVRRYWTPSPSRAHLILCIKQLKHFLSLLCICIYTLCKFRNVVPYLYWSSLQWIGFPVVVWPSFVLICPDSVSKDQLDQQWTRCHISTASSLARGIRHWMLGCRQR